MQHKTTFILFSLVISLFSCNPGVATAPPEIAELMGTPVTITHIGKETLSEFIELNAVSTYLQKWMVKANATGYLQMSGLQLNSRVSKGQSIYTIKTKEAQSIGNTINALDSTFKFSGTNTIKSVSDGFISQLDHQRGDYVQDGEQLAIITDSHSFVFLLDLPYELRPYVTGQHILNITLPDGQVLNGTVGGTMPLMDIASQTERVILRVNNSRPIPENLIGTVKLAKVIKSNAISLPKAALLTDEIQENFWVMKMIDSATAIKVPVQKGIETAERIEIISPIFSTTDRILVTGNYGLPDTAHVKIIRP